MRPAAEPLTLTQLCTARAATHGDRLAVGDENGALSYAELATSATSVAAQLAGLGVSTGDRVALIGPNCVPWVVAALGIGYAGATVVPIGHGSSHAERTRILDSLRPRLVIAESAPATLTFADLDSGRAARPPLATAAPDADAVVLPSSGTSGTVKYVAMTHRQLLRLYTDVSATVGLTEGDRLLGVVPLAHSFGLNGVLLISLIAGAYVRLARRYAAGQLAALVRDERLTVLAGPPTIYHDLASGGRADLGGTCRLAITGSTEISAPAMRATCDLLGIPEIVVGYGMTETCGTVALGGIPREVSAAEPALAPVPGVEVMIAGEAGESLLPREEGRILVRGFNVVGGYATERDGARDTGWSDTGDLGRIDEQGLLTVVGRSKDSVIVSGFNVRPAEVEDVLIRHGAVADVAVVGVADGRQGQRLVAFVVPLRGAAIDDDDLIAFGRTHLAAYKVPREFVVVEELPRTTTGKVERARLRTAAGSRKALGT
ncbi:AMP-binding protein [Saccharomonospora sp. NPDC006951]